MTPEQARESEQASVAFHTALVALGAQTVLDSLSLWEDVPPVPASAGARATTKWLATAVKYVMRRRIRARDLALAYYRYQRALTTGTTIALPGQQNPPYMTLPELKRLFEDQLEGIPLAPKQAQEQATEALPDSPPTTETPEVSEAVSEDDSDDSGRIPVEEIPGLSEALAQLEEEAEAQIKDNLLTLGPKNQDKKITKVRPDASVDEGRKKAHEDAGRRQAATAARGAMNGARGPLFQIADRDRRAIGFVRVSKTGTPCGFCAMLISRGPMLKADGRQPSLYRSSSGTGPKADGTIVTYDDLDLYHDNCQCYAIPVFDIAQFESNEIFALNRKYAELWPIVTKGLGGEDAIAAWRKFIRREAKSQKAQEAAA